MVHPKKLYHVLNGFGNVIKFVINYYRAASTIVPPYAISKVHRVHRVPVPTVLPARAVAAYTAIFRVPLLLRPVLTFVINCTIVESIDASVSVTMDRAVHVPNRSKYYVIAVENQKLNYVPVKNFIAIRVVRYPGIVIVMYVVNDVVKD